ncbi:MAG: aminoglycoside phosphotransferase family protein [Clostridia bacterium]|nr:aminoglycoside phosphotransferase family protein [Clostridia bacterium]
MTREEACAKKQETLSEYSHIGKIISCELYGNGHINDTFLTVTENKRYILQRINNTVFPHPDEIMENIAGVTEHIRAKAGDPKRATLTVVKTNNGAPFYKDSIGSYWRMYDFVEGTVARDRAEGIEDFETCGEAFGRFQGMLADFDASRLHEAIVNFHNTPVRYENLMRAVAADKVGRAESVREEISFAMAHEEFAKTLALAYESGDLPLRVTHNDTKLNNILFDSVNKAPVCVIDLDTVMGGFSVNDFGDSIRFGANTAAEDETDLSLVSLDLGLFEAYTRGFLRGCDGRLTEKEIELLPVGAMMMTFECGMRFLTDYLEGDVYFRIHHEGHNLERARNQFALVADMEKKLDAMKTIVASCNK